MAPTREVPPRVLPVVYFGFGHLCLAAGLLLAALEPEAIAGFFYHPRMFAVVHLVTLGWITTAILGATYVVGPIALRVHIAAGLGDALACAAVLAGILGVVAHFLLATYAGVGWSGILLLPALVFLAGKFLRALRRSRAPAAVRAHIGLAYGNLVLAAVVGVLLAFNRDTPFLPQVQLATVYGHVHVAVVGWAVMMVAGVGYRLLPMFLPAHPPAGAGPWLSAILLETGVLGLLAAYLFAPRFAPPFAALAASGVLVFLVLVARMRHRRVPGPHGMPRPDIGMLHAIAALGYLLLCVGIGLALAFAAELDLRLVMAYGVFGLLGFLGQIILGIEMRLLPMFAWLEAYARGGFTDVPPPPHAFPARPLQGLSFLLWTLGVPALAAGLAFDRLPWVEAGAWALFAGTLCAGVNSARVLARAFRRPAAVR